MRQIARSFLLLVSLLLCQAHAESDPVVFESRAPGAVAVWASYDSQFRAQTFRLHQRTQITALGIGNLIPQSDGSGQTLFAALYRLDTPHSTPDVVGESGLLATTLIEIPAATDNATGELALTVEPGLYAIVTGRGRHGASAQGGHAGIGDNGTPAHPDSWWTPYTLDPSTGERTWTALTVRFFLHGQTLPPVAAPSSQFRMETARPQAWWDQSANPINSGVWYGTRFEITRHTRIDRAGTWLYGGSGELFAAIVRLSGPDALPLPPSHPGFMNALEGLALVPVDAPHQTYWAHFDDTVLPPGHYALAFGSGHFGASGSASSMRVADNVLVPGQLIWIGSPGYWLWSTGANRMFVVEGVKPDIVVTPNPVDFGTVAIGQSGIQSMLVTNWSETSNVSIVQIELESTNFSLEDDTIDCEAVMLWPGQDCVFSVSFNPTASGEDSAVLRITTDGEPGLIEIALSGTAAVPELSFDSPSLDFGAVLTDADGLSLLATLSNTGQAAATDLALNLTGSPAFTVSGGDCGDAIAAGQDCQIQLSFLPASEGTATATLTATGAQGLVTAELPLSGTGLAPRLETTPESLNFGTLVMGAERARSFQVVNRSSGDVQLLDLILDSGSEGFSIDAGGCQPGILLGPDQGCMVTIRFAPDAAASYAGSVLLGAGKGMQATVSLSGQGATDTLFRDRFESP